MPPATPVRDRFFVAAFVAACAPALCASAMAQDAWIVGLAPLAGDISTQPASGTSISQFASVLAGTSISPQGRQMAVRFEQTVTRPLGTLPGLSSSIAAACSADGETIVGVCIGGASARAFRWRGGEMTDLGMPPVTPASFPRATSVSWDGSIIGGVVATGVAGTTSRGWVHEAGVYTLVPLLAGGNSSSIRAISGDGLVAVGDATTATTTVAIAWRRQTQTIELVSPAGSGPCSAVAVNGDGSIILGNCGSVNDSRAVVWSGEQPIVLPPLSPTDAAWQAVAMSGDGGLIGGSSGDRACVWSLGDLRARSVEDLLSIRGVDLSSWKLLLVTAVSSDGQYIAGSGEFTSPSGIRHNQAWLARIPSFCPTDWNADGGLDGADVGSFFDSWEAGSADLNLDGGTDGTDIDEFFARWSGGEC